MTTPTAAVDWRQHATPEAQQAFADAQARLDEGDYPPGEEGASKRWRDEVLTERYDRLVLGPAHYEHLRQCDEAEFAQHFPEPGDGARIEFSHDGTTYGAFRDDVLEGPTGDWWVYGEEDQTTWRALVVRFQIDTGELAFLAVVDNHHQEGQTQ
jgi:hypothetical protein